MNPSLRLKGREEALIKTYEQPAWLKNKATQDTGGEKQINPPAGQKANSIQEETTGQIQKPPQHPPPTTRSHKDQDLSDKRLKTVTQSTGRLKDRNLMSKEYPDILKTAERQGKITER